MVRCRAVRRGLLSLAAKVASGTVEQTVDRDVFLNANVGVKINHGAQALLAA